jgi:hypothetical protein
VAEDSLLSDYATAVASERKDRAEAVLALPELIAGVRVEALTPRRLEWLRACGNPFICGGECPVAAIPEFIWHIIKDFRFGDDERRRAFLAAVIDLNEYEAREGIDAYLDRAFLDAPSGSDSVGYYAPTVGLYNVLNEYFPSAGWSLATVLDTPLRVIYQLIKCADKQRGCVVVNRRSDAVKGRMLDKVESFDVNTESEIDPLIESKRGEGYGLFCDPMFRGGKWLVTMRKLSDA